MRAAEFDFFRNVRCQCGGVLHFLHLPCVVTHCKVTLQEGAHAEQASLAALQAANTAVSQSNRKINGHQVSSIASTADRPMHHRTGQQPLPLPLPHQAIAVPKVPSPRRHIYAVCPDQPPPTSLQLPTPVQPMWAGQTALPPAFAAPGQVTPPIVAPRSLCIMPGVRQAPMHAEPVDCAVTAQPACTLVPIGRSGVSTATAAFACGLCRSATSIIQVCHKLIAGWACVAQGLSNTLGLDSLQVSSMGQHSLLQRNQAALALLLAARQQSDAMGGAGMPAWNHSLNMAPDMSAIAPAYMRALALANIVDSSDCSYLQTEEMALARQHLTGFDISMTGNGATAGHVTGSDSAMQLTALHGWLGMTGGMYQPARPSSRFEHNNNVLGPLDVHMAHLECQPSEPCLGHSPYRPSGMHDVRHVRHSPY